MVTFGVVFNGKSGFLHGLYYQNISYNGHYLSLIHISDLMTGYLKEQEKMVWMLVAFSTKSCAK